MRGSGVEVLIAHLCSEVLLHSGTVVYACFDRGVIGNEHALDPVCSVCMCCEDSGCGRDIGVRTH